MKKIILNILFLGLSQATAFVNTPPTANEDINELHESLMQAFHIVDEEKRLAREETLETTFMNYIDDSFTLERDTYTRYVLNSHFDALIENHHRSAKKDPLELAESFLRNPLSYADFLSNVMDCMIEDFQGSLPYNIETIKTTIIESIKENVTEFDQTIRDTFLNTLNGLIPPAFFLNAEVYLPAFEKLAKNENAIMLSTIQLYCYVNFFKTDYTVNEIVSLFKESFNTNKTPVRSVGQFIHLLCKMEEFCVPDDALTPSTYVYDRLSQKTLHTFFHDVLFTEQPEQANFDSAYKGFFQRKSRKLLEIALSNTSDYDRFIAMHQWWHETT